jgi:hypothetical protein
MEPGEVLRRELLAFLEGGNAHVSFDVMVSGRPKPSYRQAGLT